MPVERIYGVVHEEVVKHLFGDSEVISVEPTPELLAYLRSLPSGSRVGVETFRELWDGVLTHDALGLFSNSEHYWESVIQVCRESGLNVLFLDDLETFKKYLEKLHEAQRCRHSLNRESYYDNMPEFARLTPEEERELREQAHRAQAEAEYIHIFIREDRIAQNILEYSPKVVIIGSGHADVFCSQGGLLNKDGLFTNAYYKEVFQPDGSQQLIQGGDDERGNFLVRERVQRRYNAATLWRVIPERTPNFIGSFRLYNRTEGLFEIYLSDSNKFVGVCEDCIGRAQIEGAVTDEGIRFIKTYDREWTSDNPYYQFSGTHAIPWPIVYEGVFTGTKYEGEWGTPSSKPRGRFVLFRGSRFDCADS